MLLVCIPPGCIKYSACPRSIRSCGRRRDLLMQGVLQGRSVCRVTDGQCTLFWESSEGGKAAVEGKPVEEVGCESGITQSCLTLCNPMDHTVDGILQARILEWVAFPSPGHLPNPGIKPVSPALQADSLPTELSGKQGLAYS